MHVNPPHGESRIASSQQLLAMTSASLAPLLLSKSRNSRTTAWSRSVQRWSGDNIHEKDRIGGSWTAPECAAHLARACLDLRAADASVRQDCQAESPAVIRAQT